MHALIVDDSPDRLEDLMAAFLRKGAQVTGCRGATLAALCLQSNLVDALVISGDLPLSFLADLLQMARYRNPQVVCLRLHGSGSTARPRQDALRVMPQDAAPDRVSQYVLTARAAQRRLQATPNAVVLGTDGAPVFASVRRGGDSTVVTLR